MMMLLLQDSVLLKCLKSPECTERMITTVISVATQLVCKMDLSITSTHNTRTRSSNVISVIIFSKQAMACSSTKDRINT